MTGNLRLKHLVFKCVSKFKSSSIMKKIFLVLMTVAISGVAMAAKSDPASSATGMTVVREGSTFKLFYKSPQQSNVTVTIYDEANRIVFSESFRESNGFIRPYNFGNLNQGEYTIE